MAKAREATSVDAIFMCSGGQIMGGCDACVDGRPHPARTAADAGVREPSRTRLWTDPEVYVQKNDDPTMYS